MKRLANVAVIKTAWYSLRFRAPVIVGRHSRLRVARGARLNIRGVLIVGIAHTGSIGATLDVRPRGELAVTGLVQVMRGCRVKVGWDARLEIGDGTYINDGAIIECGNHVTVGERCAIAWRTAILDTDTHQVIRDGEPRPRSVPVEIGDRCWIGSDTTILKGVTVGSGAVIAARSVVTRDVPPQRLAAGNPARVLDGEIDWVT